MVKYARVILPAVLVIGVFCLAIAADAPSSNKETNGNSGDKWIIPILNDLPERLKGVDYNLSQRKKTVLMPLTPNLDIADSVIGGGQDFGRPSSDMPNRWWCLCTRYIIYSSTSEALKNWKHESNRSRAYEDDSFSGHIEADACGFISTPHMGWYELHIVRHNVSVEISANIGKTDEATNKLVRDTMEIWARAILKRIEEVGKDTGKLDMTNLPPVQPLRKEPGRNVKDL